MSIPNTFILDDDELVPCSALRVGDVLVAKSTTDPTDRSFHAEFNGKTLPYRHNYLLGRCVVERTGSDAVRAKRAMNFDVLLEVASQYWRRGTDYGHNPRDIEPGELLVEGRDLQSGDAVLARWVDVPEYAREGKVGRGNMYGQVMIVQSVGDLVRVRCWSSHMGRVESHTMELGQKYWIRPRRGATQGSRFPHTCSHCGQAAYVGFTRIEHAVAGACVAR